MRILSAVARLALALTLTVVIFFTHGPRPNADDFRFNSNAFRYYCQAVSMRLLADERAATARAADITAIEGFGAEADHMVAVVNAMDRLSASFTGGEPGRAVNELRTAEAWFPTCTNDPPRPMGS